MLHDGPMPSTTFTDFDHAIDQLHELFDEWDETGAFTSAIGTEGVYVMRLMVHEWVANLLQHATFQDDRRITVEVEPLADEVRCTIEDSSLGFDFAGQVEEQKAILEAPSPSERGRGLLMLVTCAEELSYRPASHRASQRVSFVLHDPVQGDLAPLFHDADKLPDADDLMFAPSGTSDPSAPRASTP